MHGDDPGADAGADSGYEVVRKKAARPPVAHKLVSEHVKGQHVEKYMADAAVKEHVGRKPPQRVFLGDDAGFQPEKILNQAALEQVLERKLRYINSRIDDDQKLDYPGGGAAKK